MGECFESTNCGGNCEAKQSDQELEKQYKRRLENWREVLLHMNSLLLWNKPYYPGIIAAYITFVFITLWYFEPSLLTTLSILGIIACILDFAVPALSSCVFDSNKWSGAEEKKFEEICQSLIQAKHKMQEAWTCVNKFKETKPKMYFAAVVGGLMFLAWIGNLVNNLLLMYFVVLMVSLFPGIKHHGIWEQHISHFSLMIKDMVAEKTKQN